MQAQRIALSAPLCFAQTLLTLMRALLGNDFFNDFRTDDAGNELTEAQFIFGCVVLVRGLQGRGLTGLTADTLGIVAARHTGHAIYAAPLPATLACWRQQQRYWLAG